MITQRHLIDLGFLPLLVNKTIAFTINNRCQGVLANGVFHFKLSAEGEYLQANNINHLKWLFKKEHKYGILQLEMLESIHNGANSSVDSDSSNS
jgi:hypothetical protein